MAFNLAARFPRLKEMDECIFGPGAYQNQMCRLITKNKVPFNSNARRDTVTLKPYSEQLYNPVFQHHIPNCVAFKSNTPRFPYESLTKEDIEKLICRCSMECECPLEEDMAQPKKEVCQKEVSRKLIVGRPPRSIVLGGLPCKPDTSKTEIHGKVGEPDPPFYDTKVFETTTFYHGCKWSQRTAKRFQKNIEESEIRPGPDVYSIDPKPREDVICAEKIRFLRRKASKQPRLAEILQNFEMRHGGPGPAAYYPIEVNHNAVSISGSKANRFVTKKYEITPGPASYTLKSQFDLPEPPTKICHTRLPEPPFFGSKAPRFKPQIQQVGPGPSDYAPKVNLCKIQHCVEGSPFGASAPRFKPPKVGDEYFEEESGDEEEKKLEKKECKQPSWMFRSTSRRGEKSPRDYSKPVEIRPEGKYTTIFIRKKRHNPHIAPFQTSEGRFLPWYNWMSVQGKLVTPGPGTYSIEKPKCYHPAVCRGPLFRAPKTSFFTTMEGPAPNVRNISRGLNKKTFNLRLQKNELKRTSGYKWVPPKVPRKLTLEEKESLLFKQSIALLDDTSVLQCTPKESKMSLSTSRMQIKSSNTISLPNPKTEIINQLKKPKLLRCFLGHQVHCH